MSTHRREILDRWADQARTGRSPTREAWADDLRRLGAIDRDTARALTAGGVPRWPTIPPFEDVQGEELACRVVDRDDREHLRRIATHALGDLDVPAEAATEPPTALAGPSPIDPTVAEEPPASSPAPVRHRARAPLPTHDRRRTTRLGRWVVTLLALVAVAGAVVAIFSGDPAAVEPWHEPETEPTAEASDLRAVEARVAELAAALEASDDPELVAIHDRHLAPLLTLEPEAWRARPELAAATLALACRRSGATLVGLTREAELVSAVASGWIGGEPALGIEPPLDALRSLIDWVEAGGRP